MKTQDTNATRDYSLIRKPAITGPTGQSGNSESTLQELIHEGLYPPGVRISRRAVAWPKHEIETMNQARIAGLDDQQIRKLVTKLLGDREKMRGELLKQLPDSGDANQTPE